MEDLYIDDDFSDSAVNMVLFDDEVGDPDEYLPIDLFDDIS